ncbi:hypothetical protein VTH06DRAFT_6123 [Thermothelomyces fergusii]
MQVLHYGVCRDVCGHGHCDVQVLARDEQSLRPIRSLQHLAERQFRLAFLAYLCLSPLFLTMLPANTLANLRYASVDVSMKVAKTELGIVERSSKGSADPCQTLSCAQDHP